MRLHWPASCHQIYFHSCISQFSPWQMLCEETIWLDSLGSASFSYACKASNGYFLPISPLHTHICYIRGGTTLKGMGGLEIVFVKCDRVGTQWTLLERKEKAYLGKDVVFRERRGMLMGKDYVWSWVPKMRSGRDCLKKLNPKYRGLKCICVYLYINILYIIYFNVFVYNFAIQSLNLIQNQPFLNSQMNVHYK